MVDDVALEAKEYIASLKAFSTINLIVELCRTTGKLKDHLSPGKEWDLFLVDMMMPPGTLFKDIECGRGRFTGALVVEEIRKVYPQVPILLFSGTPFTEVREACEKIPMRVKNCAYWQKGSLQPRELAEKIDKLFTGGALEENKSWWDRLFGALLLEPNMAGIGIDVRKLGGD